MTAMLPILLADSRGLDFLNSIATPIDTPVDWLADGQGLLNWLTQARLVEEGVIAEIRRTALPGELDAVAAQARALRDWFRGFVNQHRGAPLGTDTLSELEPLNRILERDDGYLQVLPGANGAPFTVTMHRRWRSPDALLLPIAAAIADSVAEDDFTHVKACEGHNCSLTFIDRTRNHARRWCSMDVCGNRAKQAAHRERSARTA